MDAHCTALRPLTSSYLGIGKTSVHYRRRATLSATKAPRKRTYVMTIMEKFSERRPLHGPALPLASQCCCAAAVVCQPCCGDNDIGNNNNGGNINNKMLGPNNGDDNSSPFSGSAIAVVSRAVILGAAVIIASLVFAPGKAAAATAGIQTAVARWTARPGGKKQKYETKRLRNLCLSLDEKDMSCKQNRKGASTSSLSSDAIVYGEIELTASERRMMANRQLFLRETIRSEAMKV